MAVSTMTMNDMNEYIESKGYIVERKYVSKDIEYKFVISDGTFKKEYLWKYDRKANKKEVADRMLNNFVASKKRLEPFNLVSRGLIGDIEHGYEYFEDLSTIDNMIEKFNNSKLNNAYISEDIAMGYGTRKEFIIPELNNRKLTIKDVIFNAPATIVFWSDGTKTVVKAQNNEKYDREKGLAMAITKKFLGNQGNYYETIKKWIK